jgi:hypothetical protein
MNDMFLNGDPVEKKYGNIFSFMNSYKRIWDIYIGPKNRFIINNNDEPRILYSQYSYTILESMVCMLRIKVLYSEPIIIKEFDSDIWIDFINAFITYYSHVGRIRDCSKKIGNIYKLENIDEKFEELWLERNTVLHEHRLPMLIHDGIIFTEFSNDSREYNWTNGNIEYTKCIQDLYSNTIDKIDNILMAVFSKVLDKIKTSTYQKDFQDDNINIVTPSGILIK